MIGTRDLITADATTIVPADPITGTQIEISPTNPEIRIRTTEIRITTMADRIPRTLGRTMTLKIEVGTTTPTTPTAVGKTTVATTEVAITKRKVTSLNLHKVTMKVTMTTTKQTIQKTTQKIDPAKERLISTVFIDLTV